MASPGAAYEPQEIAGELKVQLNQHRDEVARAVATPAVTPMFTRDSTGALIDRTGRVVVDALKSLPA